MSDDPVVMSALAATWVALGLLVVVCGVRSARHPRARLVGRAATAVLFLAAGAAVNAAFLAGGSDYSGFAGGSFLPFVQQTWQSLVVPRHGAFIGLLVGFEAALGIAVLLGGRATRLGYLAAVAFHVGLLAFGWGFWLWSVPMITGLGLLLRAERRAAAEPDARGGTSPRSLRARSPRRPHAAGSRRVTAR